MMTKIHVIVPAAGSGRRMQSEVPKQYLSLSGEPVLAHTLKRLLAALPNLASLHVALTPGDRQGSDLIEQLSLACPDKYIAIVPGGSERCDSVLSALAALQEIAADEDWVMVHDAARPCVRGEDISQMMAVLARSPDVAGGLLAVPVSATLKRSDSEDCVLETVDRQQMWAAATPQTFRFQALRQALQAAVTQQAIVTDEASAMEASGARVKLIPCQPDNIKITWQGDMAMAEAILNSQSQQEPQD